MLMCFLIHDNGTTFTAGFDSVFQAQGIEVFHTPFHAPNTNAFAERWIRSVRRECLDKLVLVGEWHVRRVIGEDVTFYNTRRPHQGLYHDGSSSPLLITASRIQQTQRFFTRMY